MVENAGLKLKQVPFTEKQPPDKLIPLAKVDVAKPVTAKLATARPPEKVEVELVPKTLRKPWSVEVPVIPL